MSAAVAMFARALCVTNSMMLYRYKASQQVLEHAEDFCAQATSSATTMSKCREHHDHPHLWTCHVLSSDTANVLQMQRHKRAWYTCKRWLQG